MVNKLKAIKSLRSAIAMLDKAADSLAYDDSMRRRIICKRQDIEDLLTELESE